MERAEFERLHALEEGHWRFRALRRTLRAALERHAPRPLGRVLDAGCGCGATARELAALAPLVALDREALALRLAARAGTPGLVRGGVEALPFADAAFGAVVSVDVLYHRGVADDAAALAELARVCRPGGVVLLWLPAYEALRSSHDAAVHTARRYTRTGVARLARAAGLHPERLGYAHALLLPAAAARRALDALRPAGAPASVADAPPRLAALLERALAAEDALARRLPLPLGLSVFAVLRKR